MGLAFLEPLLLLQGRRHHRRGNALLLHQDRPDAARGVLGLLDPERLLQVAGRDAPAGHQDLAQVALLLRQGLDEGHVGLHLGAGGNQMDAAAVLDEGEGAFQGAPVRAGLQVHLQAQVAQLGVEGLSRREPLHHGMQPDHAAQGSQEPHEAQGVHAALENGGGKAHRDVPGVPTPHRQEALLPAIRSVGLLDRVHVHDHLRRSER